MPDNDHDLLIKLSANVTHIVNEIADLKSAVAGISCSLPLAAETTNTKLNAKVDWGKFWGMCIILVGILVGTIGYNFREDAIAHTQVIRNAERIDVLQKGDKHVDSDTWTD